MSRVTGARTIVRVGRVDSTQTLAFALASAGAADGTAVVADSQAAGRGRRGRVWIDEPGASLLVSILLRPRLDAARLPGLSLAAGVAVAEALMRAAGVTPRLKWPNDVLLTGRKVAGILLESRLDPAGGPATVALGIGINLTQRAFSTDLAERATSLWLATGRRAERDALLSALLDMVDEWRRRLEREGFAPIRTRWLALADTLGRPVEVDGVAGVAVDVDADGALVIADGEGRRRRVVAGEVG